MFTGVSHVVLEYESSWMMIYAQISSGQRVVAVRHCVTVAFLFVFLCAECRGDLIYQMEYPTVMEKFADFSVKTYIPFLKDACEFVLPFRSCRVLAGPHAEEKFA